MSQLGCSATQSSRPPVPPLEQLLGAIGRDGQLGIRLASIICALVVKGGELGELEEYQAAGPGETPRMCRGFRREWITRLAKALEKGALAHLDDERIVEILLQG